MLDGEVTGLRASVWESMRTLVVEGYAELNGRSHRCLPCESARRQAMCARAKPLLPRSWTSPMLMTIVVTRREK